jgi:hypothetical protein
MLRSRNQAGQVPMEQGNSAIKLRGFIVEQGLNLLI